MVSQFRVRSADVSGKWVLRTACSGVVACRRQGSASNAQDSTVAVAIVLESTETMDDRDLGVDDAAYTFTVSIPMLLGMVLDNVLFRRQNKRRD